MANTLTNLATDILVSHDRVLRELVGFIPSVTINAGAERVAYNDTVRSFFTRPVTPDTSYAPAMTIPEGTDQTIDTKTMTLNNYASVKIPWTGEDVKHVNNGFGFDAIRGDQFSQALRGIFNLIEAGVAVAAKQGSSRAYGTAGTTPFASNFNEIPQLRKILADNGVPFDGQVSLVMDTTAGANLRSLATLNKVNESGDSSMLRQGTMLDLQGFMLKESAGISLHTKGTGSGYALNNASGYPVGSTSIAVDTGSGTILAGDIFTNSQSGRDTNKYVVNTALSGGSLTIGAPGNRVAWVDNDTVAIGNNYTPNMAFHRSAIELAIRPPSQPPGGDAADDTILVTDPLTGVTIEFALYRGYQKVMIEARCFWAVKVWKPEMVATLIG